LEILRILKIYIYFVDLCCHVLHNKKTFSWFANLYREKPKQSIQILCFVSTNYCFECRRLAIVFSSCLIQRLEVTSEEILALGAHQVTIYLICKHKVCPQIYLGSNFGFLQTIHSTIRYVRIRA
jgi:hypothetical protein